MMISISSESLSKYHCSPPARQYSRSNPVIHGYAPSGPLNPGQVMAIWQEVTKLLHKMKNE